MSIQQQQGDEERRRAEEEQLAADLKAAAYVDHYAKRDRDWEYTYDGRGDMAPDGRNIADTNRRVIGPQMRAIAEQSQRSKERK